MIRPSDDGRLGQLSPENRQSLAILRGELAMLRAEIDRCLAVIDEQLESPARRLECQSDKPGGY